MFKLNQRKKPLPEKKRMLFLIPCSDLIPSGKVRVLNYLPHLQERGIECKVMNFYHPLILKLRRQIQFPGKVLFLFSHFLKKVLKLIDKLYQWMIEMRFLLAASRSHVVMIQWETPPRYIISLLLKLNSNLIFDYDDTLRPEKKLNTDFLVANSKTVVAGSHYFRNYAKGLNNNVVVIPSSIPIEKFDLYRNEFRPHRDSRVVIGWIGSESTFHHLEILKEVFDIIKKNYMLQLKVVGTGNRNCPIKGDVNLEIVTVKYYNEDEMVRHAFSFDIGIVPLKEIKESYGKTSLKALVYMAAGIPVVCSQVGEYKEIIQNGINGFFASSKEDWIEKLSLLIENRPLREMMGNRGLNLVRERYTNEICFNTFYKILKELI